MVLEAVKNNRSWPIDPIDISLPLWNEIIVSLSSSIIWTRRPLMPITFWSHRQNHSIDEMFKCKSRGWEKERQIKKFDTSVYRHMSSLEIVGLSQFGNMENDIVVWSFYLFPSRHCEWQLHPLSNSCREFSLVSWISRMFEWVRPEPKDLVTAVYLLGGRCPTTLYHL